MKSIAKEKTHGMKDLSLKAMESSLTITYYFLNLIIIDEFLKTRTGKRKNGKGNEREKE